MVYIDASQVPYIYASMLLEVFVNNLGRPLVNNLLLCPCKGAVFVGRHVVMVLLKEGKLLADFKGEVAAAFLRSKRDENLVPFFPSRKKRRKGFYKNLFRNSTHLYFL